MMHDPDSLRPHMAVDVGSLLDSGVIAVRLALRNEVSVRWPTWDGVDAWDVWDARRHLQGATKVATRTTLVAALECAAQVQACDLETREGREARNKIMRGES